MMMTRMVVNGAGSGVDDEDNDSDDNDSDDDGFRGAKVRGENYGELKAMERQAEKKKKSKKKDDKNGKKKSKKNVMYEADDYVDGDVDAIQIGLGGFNRKRTMEKRTQEINMSLEDRLKLENSKTSNMGETRYLHVKGEGAAKELTYIPKDVLAKREKDKMKQDQEDDINGAQNKRKRRGIKDLGLKTPFKNHR